MIEIKAALVVALAWAIFASVAWIRARRDAQDFKHSAEYWRGEWRASQRELCRLEREQREKKARR